MDVSSGSGPECECGSRECGLVVIEGRYWCVGCLQTLITRLRAEAEAQGPLGGQRVHVERAKSGFLNLCVQYKQLGTYLKLTAKALTHPLFQKSSVPGMLQKSIDQYQEIGEQMKSIGEELDNTGGTAIMYPEAAKFAEPTDEEAEQE